MAHLATVASHHINGVAALHSRLLRETVLRDFAELWPERFTNVTNGVTPRRFVALANPRLATLITEAIGDGWLRDLDRLREPREARRRRRRSRTRWRAVKQANKTALATWLADAHGLTSIRTSLFDAQCKRIHEYKRQHLNLLHVDRAVGAAAPRRGPRTRRARSCSPARRRPRTATAKLIIRLAHGVGERDRRRSARARPAARRVRARLQRQDRAADLPGGRPVASRSRRRAWRRRAPAT